MRLETGLVVLQNILKLITNLIPDPATFSLRWLIIVLKSSASCSCNAPPCMRRMSILVVISILVKAN